MERERGKGGRVALSFFCSIRLDRPSPSPIISEKKKNSQHLASLYCVAAFSSSSAASSYLFPPKSENDVRRLSAFFTSSRARAAAPSVAIVFLVLSASVFFSFSFVLLSRFESWRSLRRAPALFVRALSVRAKGKSSGSAERKRARERRGRRAGLLSLLEREGKKKKVMVRNHSLSFFLNQSSLKRRWPSPAPCLASFRSDIPL